MPIMHLNELEPKQAGKILKVRGVGPLRQRMMDMGMVPGAEIKVIRVAPLGDPIEYQLKGYRLSLRHHEAHHILVDVEVLTLDQIPANTTASLMEVNGGNQLKHRLEEMNLIPERTFVVLKNPGDGPIKIKVGEKELPIGRGMAKKLLAKPIDGVKS